MGILDQAKLVLKERYPHIYSPMRKLYYSFYRYPRAMLLPKEKESEYLKKPSEFSEKSLSAQWINHPGKRFLVEAISRHAPISSILEVGCNAGPNLYLLAKRFPQASIRGIDINHRSVRYGNEWFAGNGIDNIRLSVGRAQDLTSFPDASFDVVFTDALLVVIHPRQIRDVITGMLRLAKKALVMMEWHCFDAAHKDPRGLGHYHLGFWKRDYGVLLEEFVPEGQISIEKIPEDCWTDEGWREFGAVIGVRVR